MAIKARVCPEKNNELLCKNETTKIIIGDK